MSLLSAQSDVADGLISVAFNQDCSCFTVGTDFGLRVFNTIPLKEKIRHECNRRRSFRSINFGTSDLTGNVTGNESSSDGPSLDTPGGIEVAEMMYRTNYIALVGGGKNPKFPPNKVIIWDDLKHKSIIELEFRSVVKAVRLRRERIVVALSHKVFVYTFSVPPQRLHVFDTCENNGILAFCPSPTLTSAPLAFPGRTQGQVQLVDLPVSSNRQAQPAVSIIPAHDSPLSCLSVSYTGTLLASASTKGTLIRIFEVRSGRRVNELRRGADKAEIFCIAFNPEATRVCVSSDKGTVHIFNLTSGQLISKVKGERNRLSTLSFLSPYVPYFKSEWSFAQFNVPSESKCICAFVPVESTPLNLSTESIVVLCADGSYYKFSFDKRKGGECVREAFHRFYMEGSVGDEYTSQLISSSFGDKADDKNDKLVNWEDVDKDLSSLSVQQAGSSHRGPQSKITETPVMKPQTTEILVSKEASDDNGFEDFNEIETKDKI